MTHQFEKINTELKPGFIFVPCQDSTPYPSAYLCERRGLVGFFAKLDKNDLNNGWDSVTVAYYRGA